MVAGLGGAGAAGGSSRARLGDAATSCSCAVVRASDGVQLWHLPLFWTVGPPLYGEPFLIMLVELLAMSVLYTWVLQHTAGSGLLAILFHASWSAWWSVFTVSAAEANCLRSMVVLALKWALAAAVAVSWLRQVPARNRRRLVGAP
jgi:hypothetical protein